MTGEPVDVEPTKRQWLGYWSMIVQQTQNAFNDKMAQFILIPLAAAVSFTIPVWPGIGMGLETAAAVIISLPFILFAPIAGWLSDRFSKRLVMIGAACAQIIILGWLCLSIFMGNMWMALIGFFGLAMQSAFFSPAKMGINKELVGSKHLGFATGIQQMAAMLAIMIGQIVAGKWYDARWTSLGGKSEQAWDAGLFPMVILFVTAIPALVMAWIIPKVPAQGGAKFTKQLATSHFANLKDLWSHEGLRRGALGVSFFWGIAAFINLWSIKLAKHLTDGGPGFGSMSSDYMASASIGMVVGFGLASYLLRKRIELGWVPMAGILMALSALVFLILPFGGFFFMGNLAILAFGSALFLAPLNAWMQDTYPSNKRGEYQSAVNLLNTLSAIIATGLIEAFNVAGNIVGISGGLSLRLQMVFVGLACACATWGIIRMLPGDLLRMVALFFVRLLSCRTRAANVERIPKTGGVLLLPNHITYLDAFIIGEACPRPVRFVMDERFSNSASIGWFTRVFGTVLIRRDQPLEAIRKVIGALKQGEVVCYFPEGQLSRTGGLSPLMRGFELITRKAGHPVVPTWIDGIWGSVASFERGRFFSKVPHKGKFQVTVGFGEVLDPKEVDQDSLSHALMKASAEAMHLRFGQPKWGEKTLSANGIIAEDFDDLRDEERRCAWANGHQIRMTSALEPHEKIYVWREDPVLYRLHGLLVGFAKFTHSEVVIKEQVEVHAGQVWVGSSATRVMIRRFVRGVEFDFLDFSKEALEPVLQKEVNYRPCLDVDGVVIAMSLPTPDEQPEGFEVQHGHKEGAYGRLLPGWYVEDGRVYGPAAGEEGLALPEGCKLVDGFVVGDDSDDSAQEFEI